MSGDVIVCAVREDIVITDISFMAPKGEATRVPGDLAHRSKDLWVLLSQQALFRLNEHSLMRAKVVAGPREPQEPPSPSLAGQLAQAHSDLARVTAELARAKAALEDAQVKMAALQAANEEYARSASKLDSILDLLKSRPTQVVVAGAVPRETAVDDSVPMYIPSQIKSEGTGTVSTKEDASDASSLSGAAKALKGLKKKQQ